MSDDRSRVRRLDRILKVQGQKRLLEEWRLSNLRQERETIDKDDVALLDSLGTESQLHGLFIEAKVRNLRRNEGKRSANLADQSATEQRITTTRRAEKGVEKVRDDARRNRDADEETRSLESSVEGHLARRHPSFE
ncbi:hypothetical protein [Aurantimonas coralicida]|uniref:hypothetical protein n=1 Tax=Aurantimonas coralicida TaxID=182270 RepID=UPI001E59A52E|nr:hypothetical protein [Aurantimonas coralicida]MCD1641452.1 hypothetical protein [Aurantimonas coralicida]